MGKGFKLGTGNGKRLLVMLLLLAAFSPARLHAEQRHSAIARLQIQVMVMPIVVAAQQARQTTLQPSQTPISFNLSPNSGQNGTYLTQKLTITDQNGIGKTAVLKTLTVVSE